MDVDAVSADPGGYTDRDAPVELPRRDQQLQQLREQNRKLFRGPDTFAAAAPMTAASAVAEAAAEQADLAQRAAARIVEATGEIPGLVDALNARIAAADDAARALPSTPPPPRRMTPALATVLCILIVTVGTIVFTALWLLLHH